MKRSLPERITPSPPPGWDNWEALMSLALAEAQKALAVEEVPVGAVIVADSGEILGVGHNAPEGGSDPTAHAEIAAMRAAAKKTGNYRLGGSVLVCTLEPCLMCAGALVHARVAGLVYGAADDKAGAVDSCAEALDFPFNNHAVWRMGGIRGEECRALLLEFFNKRR